MEDRETREKILTGAQGLFLKYGIRSVSMDDIARHLSISKKTIYQYFADKDEIVTVVSAYHLENDKRVFEEIKGTSRNAIDELVKVAECIKNEFKTMNPMLLFDLQKYHLKAWNLWLEHKQDHVRQSIISNLKQGIEEGFFRAELNPDIIGIARLELVQLTFDDRLFSTSKYSLAEVNQQLFDHFAYGLFTDRGRKMYEKYKNESVNNNDLIPNNK